MKTKKLFLILFMVSIAISFLYSCKCDECPEPDTQVSQYQLDKTIVETNTTNVATGFQSVFSEMITDSTDRAVFSQTFVDAALFYDDNSGYFFIETLDNAWCVAHINHDLIGTSRINVQDLNGKYFIQDIVETVLYSGHGFVEYFRKNPSTGAVERKLSYVTNIPAAQWFIGTGFYGDPPVQYYDKQEADKILLRELVRTMAKGMGAIIKDIYNSDSSKAAFCRTFIDHIRFFDNGSGYFFINDFDGINIAHGADASHEGQNDYDLQDTQGNYIIRDMIDIAKNDGSNYYRYTWNNPSSGNDEEKIVFVMRIPDTDYFIAAGFYVNDVI